MSNNESFPPPPKLDFNSPPPYSVIYDEENQFRDNVGHSKLPTYEEVQMEKSMNCEEFPPSFQAININGGPTIAPTNNPMEQQTAPFLSIETRPSTQENSENLLGTDVMFISAFLIAFVFNWIGFLLLTCFGHNIASRYGALSGFGLSLAKWTFIVKHSTELASQENSWLWWLIMAFGFLICLRALVQYISIKRTWRLLSVSAQERLLFFY